MAYEKTREQLKWLEYLSKNKEQDSEKAFKAGYQAGFCDGSRDRCQPRQPESHVSHKVEGE